MFLFFFFNDTATTEIYTLSLHDALPISRVSARRCGRGDAGAARTACLRAGAGSGTADVRGRPGRAGSARALWRDRAARQRASGKMNPNPGAQRLTGSALMRGNLNELMKQA